MIGHSWLRLSRSATFATAIFLLGSDWLSSKTSAQSVEPSGADGPPFVVAQSFPVANAPSSVSMGDFNRDGKLDLVTTDNTTGNVTVYLGTGEGKFGTGVEYPAGPHPTSVITADIDGDGNPDIVVCNASSGQVTVLLGLGNGKLQQPKSYSAGQNPAFVAAGDFNGDGQTDLAVASGSGKYVAVLLNDGKGQLGPPAFISIHKAPTALTVADFNNDGLADLALASSDGTVTILLGRGNGSFKSVPDISVSLGALSSIVAGDFNRDGKTDLAVTQHGQKALSVLLGKGDGSFAAATYGVGNSPVSASVVDVDGDAVPDLVTVNQGSNTFSVLLGNGDGTFKDSLDFVAGDAPLAAAAGDFDGDGHVDLAIINFSSQTISVPLGKGDGTFRAARSYAADLVPLAIASGDLNGDKKPDLVVVNYCGLDSLCGKAGTVAIFLADEAGGYRLSNTYTLGAGSVSVALIDANGDKNLDIIALNRGDKTISVLLGVGDGTFQQPLTFSTADSPVAVVIGDFNKDGKPDLAVVGDCGSAKCTEPGNAEILLGTGDGSFSSGFTYPVGYAPISVAVGDINKDGSPDILVANGCGNDATCKSPGTATVLVGDGKGNFKPAADIALGNAPTAIALADLTGHGVPDLLVSRSADNTLAVLRGNGDASFKAAVVYPVGNGPGSVTVADFNGDGKPDVAVANANDSTISVLYGNGEGSLQAAFSLPVGAGPQALAAVTGRDGAHASLVTANGKNPDSPGGPVSAESPIAVQEKGSAQLTPAAADSSGSASPAGSEITVLANIAPDVVPDPSITSFTLTGVPATGNVNQPIVLTATLVGSAPPVTGTVAFSISPAVPGVSLVCAESAATPKDNTSVVQVIGANDQAVCTTSSVPAGTYSRTAASDIMAAFTGTGSYVGVTPPAADLIAPGVVISPIAAKLTLTGPATTPSVNQSVTLTATLVATPITPTAPSGKISFTVNGATIADCPAVTLTGGAVKASCTTSLLTAPSSKITATYTGDNNFTAGPNTLTQTVTPLATTPLFAPTTPSSLNTVVAFTLSLTGSTFAPTVPQGTVVFTVNGKAIADCPPVKLSGGALTATCKTSSLVVPANVIGATYGGDPNFAATALASTTQIVTQIAAMTSVSGKPAPSVVNENVTFTAIVQGTTSGSVAPTGSVTFTQAGSATPPCGGPAGLTAIKLPSGAAAGTATCVAAFGQANAVGYTVTATYSGDGNFTAGTAGNITQIVNASGVTTSVTPSPTAPGVNQPVVFTTIVTSSNTGNTVPTGTVSFTDTAPGGASPVAFCTGLKLNTDGSVPSCTYALLSSGSHTITVTYSGDGNFSGSPFTFHETVSPAPTTVAVSSSPAAPVVNEPVNFTAIVTPAFSDQAPGLTKPAGAVTFTDALSGMTLCTETLASDGTVPVCTVPLLVAGAHPITAKYVPAPAPAVQNFVGSSSPSYTQAVTANTTTTAVTSSPSPSIVNQPVGFTAVDTPSTFSATGTPGSTVPQGTVTFTDALTNALLCTETLNSDGTVPVCTVPLPVAGSHPVTTTYKPSPAPAPQNFVGSSSPSYIQTVTANTTTTAVTSSPSPSTVNQQVTFTAVVTPGTAGASNPQGTVVFTDALSGTTLCTETLASDGTVPGCTVPLLVAGTHPTTATYVPAPAPAAQNFTGSSGGDSQIVNKTTTMLTVVSSSPPPSSPTSVATQAVTFTATVTPAFLSATVPSGKVSFSSPDGTTNTTCGSVALTTATAGQVSTASCTVAFPTTTGGTFNVTAAYSGDNNFGVSSSPVTQTVQNFSIAFSVQAGAAVSSGPVSVTQGYSNANDPFNAVTITANSTPVALFTDTLTVACTVTATGSTTPVSDPSCVSTLGSTMSSTLRGDGTAPLTFTLAPSATAPVGSYTVILMATDNTNPKLVQVAPPLIVNVVSQSAPLSLSPGVTGVTTAIFTGAAGTQLSSFSCPTIKNAIDGSTVTNSEITCSGPSGGFMLTGNQDKVPITIGTGTVTLARSKSPAQTSNEIATASLLGLPFLVLAGWLGRRKMSGRHLARFLSLMVLIIFLSQAIGCGSNGFTTPPKPAGGTPPGSYLVQVIATDSSNNQYFAVVPLNVN